MNMRKAYFSIFGILSYACLHAQPTINILDSTHKVSLRGLSVVTDDIVWVSGTAGSVAKTYDGGKTWAWQNVPGYEKRDFRDIEAFDSSTAIIMAVDVPAVILKTTDAGATWKKVFEDNTPGMFLDAMDFADANNGMVVGDPIDGRAFLAFTNDGGNTWVKADESRCPLLNEGEAFFAASGTNLILWKKNKTIVPVFVSGGKKSRIFPLGASDTLQMAQGSTTAGANSVAFSPNNKLGIVVGGDFANEKAEGDNCVLLTIDKKDKITYYIPQTPPHGYKSCVIYNNDNQLFSCGTTGVDISNDSGNNWENISSKSFNVVQKAKQGKSVYLAGNSKIAKVIF
ncbi:WD40/YVTN/BNR-like repeat-containing protein [Chitinophagaceae bacterium LWZ2-11]